MARTKSVVTRAKKRTSAAAQSKQIQTLAKDVSKLKNKDKRQSSSVMTITRNENVPLHRNNPQAIGGITEDIARDKAWVMPIPYAPVWTENPLEPAGSYSWANNNPSLKSANGPPQDRNVSNKRPVFGYTFLDKEVRGITHKGGTLSIRVTNTFKSPTALHFFLVKPKKEFADSVLSDIGYLSDFRWKAANQGLNFRGAQTTLREGVDYTYGAARTAIPNPSATPTPGYPETPAKNVPDLAMMSTVNWDILSYRRCFFDAGSSQTLNTQNFPLNTSANPVDNLVYKNIRMKVPAAGFIRRSRTGGSNSGMLGTIDNMDIDDQQNEKSVFLVCLRTLQEGGSTIPGGNTASNPNEYCTANITLLDKYKVSH